MSILKREPALLNGALQTIIASCVILFAGGLSPEKQAAIIAVGLALGSILTRQMVTPVAKKE